MDIEEVETIDRVQVTRDVLSAEYSTRPPNKSPRSRFKQDLDT